MIIRNLSKRVETIDDFCHLILLDKLYLQKLVRLCPLHYIEIPFKKKDGTPRPIRAPKEKLKIIQRVILDNLLSCIKLPPCCYGFSKGKSIIENAKAHLRGDYLLNLDIKDFFPSVHYTKVEKIFLGMGLDRDFTNILCNLTTHEYKLPQGAPTSPKLASVVLHNLDYRLLKLAQSNHLTYTRYFDDISFSGNKRIITLEKDILRIIREEGYSVHTSKDKKKLFAKNETKEINGILLKDKKSSLKNIDELFSYVENINRHGLSRLITDNPEKERQSIAGKISFLRQIDPERSHKLKVLYDFIEWL